MLPIIQRLSSGLDRPLAERVIRTIFPWFLGAALAATAAGVLLAHLQHNPWNVGDWLINYRGGFVRRGFPGEVFWQLSRLIPTNPGVLVSATQMIAYLAYFFFSWRLVRRQQFLLAFAPLLFSPFIFTFQVNDLQGGFRKEILYFALLSAMVYAAGAWRKATFEKIFYGALLVFPAIILSHEMLALFLPYLLILYLKAAPPGRKQLAVTGLLLLPSCGAFLLTCHHAGTADQIPAILASIATEGYAVTDSGAITWLDKPSEYGFSFLKEFFPHASYLFHYGQILILSLIAYIPIRRNLAACFPTKLSRVLLLASLAGTGLLCALAIDWGRFIYIHLVSLFLLTLIPADRTYDTCLPPRPANRIHPVLLGLFILYVTCWRIPHCCDPCPYGENTLSALVAPYRQIAALIPSTPFR